MKTSNMYDALVIGSGVIGVAIARCLARAHLKVAVLEASSAIGKETSFRNSAVLHCGLYYPQNSLKAKFCLRGKRLLEEYCDSHAVPYQRLGKVIVACNEKQLQSLQTILTQAKLNGVESLKLLDQSSLARLEPAVTGIGAIFSPSTGIIDGQALLSSLVEDLKQEHVKILVNNQVMQCEVSDFDFTVQTKTNETFISKLLINAAGLRATDIAQAMNGLDKANVPKLYLAKGNYFKYQKQTPFKHLIYPLPEHAGLGIHATLDLQGKLRFGPDVEWVDAIEYTTSESRKSQFIQAIKEYFPAIKAVDLVADHAHTGIRPKILPPLEQPQDFVIHSSGDHKIKGLINLFGIESPGLTSCLAIADYVYDSVIL